jgi:hypothetical protein
MLPLYFRLKAEYGVFRVVTYAVLSLDPDSEPRSALLFRARRYIYARRDGPEGQCRTDIGGLVLPTPPTPARRNLNPKPVSEPSLCCGSALCVGGEKLVRTLNAP